MVFAVEDEVFHPGIHGELDPLLGVELRRVELLGKWLVFLHGNLRVMHDPLADVGVFLPLPFAGRNRVEAPVDEQSVLRLIKPLELGIARRCRGLRHGRLRGRLERGAGLARQPFVKRGEGAGIRLGIAGNSTMLAEIENLLFIPQDLDGASANIVVGAREHDFTALALSVLYLHGFAINEILAEPFRVKRP